MLEQLKGFIGLQAARLEFRRDEDVPQAFTGFFSTAKNILLVLPLHYEDAVQAGKAFAMYRAQFHHVHLTLIQPNTWNTPLNDFPRANVIRLSQTDLTRFTLPTKEICRKIATQEYDIAIDLNLDFVLHTAYICKASRARVRIGCATEQAADIFYNVRLQLDRQRPAQQTYEKVAASLTMF